MLSRPVARSAAADGGEIAGLHRKRPFGHGFEHWLAWERESETGNASRDLCRASTSKAARSHEGEGKRDGESPHHTAEFLRRSRSTRRRRNKISAAARAWRAPMAARARVCEASSGGGVKGRTRGFVRC